MRTITFFFIYIGKISTFCGSIRGIVSEYVRQNQFRSGTISFPVECRARETDGTIPGRYRPSGGWRGTRAQKAVGAEPLSRDISG